MQQIGLCAKMHAFMSSICMHCVGALTHKAEKAAKACLKLLHCVLVRSYKHMQKQYWLQPVGGVRQCHHAILLHLSWGTCVQCCICP